MRYQFAAHEGSDRGLFYSFPSEGLRALGVASSSLFLLGKREEASIHLRAFDALLVGCFGSLTALILNTHQLRERCEWARTGGFHTRIHTPLYVVREAGEIYLIMMGFPLNLLVGSWALTHRRWTEFAFLAFRSAMAFFITQRVCEAFSEGSLSRVYICGTVHQKFSLR
ncbi:hypothetical protein VTJ04DRAFT_3194 [Mycothermus thermophilus]|uniref:uncharacterized protein n=1 Tax=Humicola insolens TaxID=85995 RepID=UPI003743526B